MPHPARSGCGTTDAGTMRPTSRSPGGQPGAGMADACDERRPVLTVCERTRGAACLCPEHPAAPGWSSSSRQRDPRATADTPPTRPASAPPRGIRDEVFDTSSIREGGRWVPERGRGRPRTRRRSVGAQARSGTGSVMCFGPAVRPVGPRGGGSAKGDRKTRNSLVHLAEDRQGTFLSFGPLLRRPARARWDGASSPGPGDLLRGRSTCRSGPPGERVPRRAGENGQFR